MVGLEVSDTGIGIAPDALPRVFEPFFTTKPQGSGLGLVVVKRVVEGHRGRVAVKSAPGTGTTFTILLPFGEHEASSVSAPDAE
jgi:signal transduction histidine kinase